MLLHRAGLAFIALSVTACTDTVSRNQSVGSTPVLLTTADLRIIEERPGWNGHTIVCAEPPPDVAKALSVASNASVAVTTAANVGGNAALAFASAEQLAQLAGRVPGLLALRDGMFRACEAHANGTIGDSAYALLLSRYGEILVTVVLADAASGAATSELATLAGLNLVGAPSGTGNSSTGADKGATTSPSTSNSSSSSAKTTSAAPLSDPETDIAMAPPATPTVVAAMVPDPPESHPGQAATAMRLASNTGVTILADTTPTSNPVITDSVTAVAPSPSAPKTGTSVPITLTPGTELTCTVQANGTPLVCSVAAKSGSTPSPTAKSTPAASPPNAATTTASSTSSNTDASSKSGSANTGSAAEAIQQM